MFLRRPFESRFPLLGPVPHISCSRLAMKSKISGKPAHLSLNLAKSFSISANCSIAAFLVPCELVSFVPKIAKQLLTFLICICVISIRRNFGSLDVKLICINLGFIRFLAALRFAVDAVDIHLVIVLGTSWCRGKSLSYSGSS